MKSVEEHQASVLAVVSPLAVEHVDVEKAARRVLASDVVAPWPLPSFDNSSMDGYAVRASDISTATPRAPVELQVVGDIAAGAAGRLAVELGTAARIMTGAPLPPGADTVVPVEQTDGGVAVVRIANANVAGAYVRRAGEDVEVGETVLRVGTVISERAIAVLAAVGCGVVEVHRSPRVVVISTGDELVEPGVPLAKGQISDSNGVMLAACARAAGAEVRRAPIVPDDARKLRIALDEAAHWADLVITSGGVSMGAFDTVKEVLGASGEVEFCRVAMQPGMPQGAGHLRPQGTQIITLPGNPVSSFVSFEMFVRPVLRRMQGYVDVFRPDETAVAAESFDSVANKQQFQRAQITTGPDGVRFARPLGAQGSHFLGGLAMSTGLIVVPRDVMRVEVGETVAIIDWRWLTS